MSASTTVRVDQLLRPGTIGPVELPNRVIMPAMDMNRCIDGELSDAEIAHYRARAAGGTGMLITGAGAVAFPHGAESHEQPGLSDDRFIPGLRRLVDEVHDEGSRLCVQLCHHGKTARQDIAAGRPVLVPSMPTGRPDTSALVDNTREELGKLMAATGGKAPIFKVATDEDLDWVIGEFASATDRVRRAGGDAVEIHGSHGYLPSTFLSAADNRRDDRWGGSIEGRATLIVEITRAVRAAAGADMAVIVRISGREFDGPEALTTAEAARAAQLFVEAGADAIHVSAYGRNPFKTFTKGPLPYEIGAYRGFASTIREAVDVPVIAVGRIQPELGEEMLASGDCDFVSMGRQLLADPDLVNKLRDGRPGSIRPCINCYVCVEQNFLDLPPRCAVNPAAGNDDAARWVPADPPRRVLVVGGGPAGMETARIARERGHQVTLLEASSQLGGTAWLSQLTTPDNAPLVTWLIHELDRLGVTVRTAQAVDIDVVTRLQPDVVVVATGSTRVRLDVPGVDLDHVLDGTQLRALLSGSGDTNQKVSLRFLAWAGRILGITTDARRLREVTRRWMPLGHDVVVIGGGLVGLELGEFMAERGRAVTVLEASGQLGRPMALPRRWRAVQRAADHDVELVRNATVREITRSDVTYTVGDETRSAPADTVIIASSIQPTAPLADQLGSMGVEVHVVGDAAEVGYIEGAIHSAWSIATSL